MKQDILLDSYLNLIQIESRMGVLTEEQLLEFVITDKIVNSVKDKLNMIENILKKAKINTIELKSDANEYAKKLKKDFDAGKSPEEISKDVVNHSAKVLSAKLRASKDKILEMSTTKKVLIAFLIFLAIFYINTLIANLIFLVISNPQVSALILSTIVAPMVEEAAKNYFIGKGMPWVGTGVVFGLEFLHYLTRVTVGGVSAILKFAIVRSITILMHFSTTYVQKKIIEKGEEKGEDARFKAWVVGVGIHSLYNLIAVLLNTKITAFVTGKAPTLDF